MEETESELNIAICLALQILLKHHQFAPEGTGSDDGSENDSWDMVSTGLSLLDEDDSRQLELLDEL